MSSWVASSGRALSWKHLEAPRKPCLQGLEARLEGPRSPLRFQSPFRRPFLVLMLLNPKCLLAVKFSVCALDMHAACALLWARSSLPRWIASHGAPRYDLSPDSADFF